MKNCILAVLLSVLLALGVSGCLPGEGRSVSEKTFPLDHEKAEATPGILTALYEDDEYYHQLDFAHQAVPPSRACDESENLCFIKEEVQGLSRAVGTIMMPKEYLPEYDVLCPGCPKDEFYIQRGYCTATLISPNHLYTAGHCGFANEDPECTQSYKCIREPGDGPILTIFNPFDQQDHQVTHILRFQRILPTMNVLRDNTGAVLDGSLVMELDGAGDVIHYDPNYTYDISEWPLWYKTYFEGDMVEDIYYCYPQWYHWFEDKLHNPPLTQPTEPPEIEDWLRWAGYADQMILWCGKPGIETGIDEPVDTRFSPGLNQGSVGFRLGGESGTIITPLNWNTYSHIEVGSVSQNSLITPDTYCKCAYGSCDPCLGLTEPHYRANTPTYLFGLRPDKRGKMISDWLGSSWKYVWPTVKTNLLVCHGFSGSSYFSIPESISDFSMILGALVRDNTGLLASDICTYQRPDIDDGGSFHNLLLLSLEKDLDENGIVDLIGENYPTFEDKTYKNRWGHIFYIFQKGRFIPWAREWWKSRGLDGDGEINLTDGATVDFSGLSFPDEARVRFGAWMTAAIGATVRFQVYDNPPIGGPLLVDEVVLAGTDENWHRKAGYFSVDAAGANFSSPGRYTYRLSVEGGWATVRDVSFVEKDYEWTFDTAEERESWKTIRNEANCSPDVFCDAARTIVRPQGFAGEVAWDGALVNTNVNLTSGSWVIDYRITRKDGCGECQPFVLTESGDRVYGRTRTLPEAKRGEWAWKRSQISAPAGSSGLGFRATDESTQCIIDYIKIRPGTFDTVEPIQMSLVLPAWEENTDFDGDGLAGLSDNCPWTYNPDQADSDVDESGGPAPDGVGDACDSCPAVSNECAQSDKDEDGWGDVCDLCPEVPPQDPAAGHNDEDGDGIGDECDNCLGVLNPSQLNCDSDSDPLQSEGHRGGDACDPDPCVYVTSLSEQKEWLFEERIGIGYIKLYAHGKMYDFKYQPVGYNETTGSYIDSDVMSARCQCTSFWDPALSEEENYRVCTEEQPVGENCNEGGTFSGNVQTGKGWKRMARVLDDRVHDSWFPAGHYSGDLGGFNLLWEDEAEKTCLPEGFCEDIADVSFYKEGMRHYPFWRPVPVINREVWAWREENYPRIIDTPPEVGVPGKTLYPNPVLNPPIEKLKVWLHPEVMPRNQNSAYRKGDVTFQLFTESRPHEEPIFYDIYTIGLEHEKGCPRPEEEFRVGDFYSIKIKGREGDPLPDDSIYKFPDLTPDSALEGMALLVFDMKTGTVKDMLPARSADPQMHIGYEGLMAASRVVDTSGFWAFGGKNAYGEYSSILWRGGLQAAPSALQAAGQENIFYWVPQLIDGAPPARAYGVMAVDRNGRTVIFGGESEQGFLTDLWIFDPVLMTWIKWAAGGQVHEGLARVAYTQKGDSLYLFGGEYDGGVSSKLSKLDLGTGHFTMISDAPVSRSGASLSFDGIGGRLYLYGGYDGPRWHNDLWMYDLDAGQWTRHLPDCDAGECPAASAGSEIFPRLGGGDLYVTPGGGTWRQPLWKAGMSSGEFWQSYARLAGDPTVGDCDGDGGVDPGNGFLCTPSNEWYAPLGMIGCDRTDGGQVCNAPVADGEAGTGLRLPLAQALDVAAQRGLAVAVGDSSLWVIDLAFPDSPEVIGQEWLRGWATDVEVQGRYAYVAEAWGLEIVDVFDPVHPVSVSKLFIPSFVHEIEVTKGYVYLRTSKGLSIVDAGDPSAPFVAGDVGIKPAGAEFTRKIALVGTMAYLGTGRNVVTVDISDPAAPIIVGQVETDGFVSGLRSDGVRVYGVSKGFREDVSFVLVEDPVEGTVIAGQHTVKHWVLGVQHYTGYAYRLRRWMLEVVRVW